MENNTNKKSKKTEVETINANSSKVHSLRLTPEQEKKIQKLSVYYGRRNKSSLISHLIDLTFDSLEQEYSIENQKKVDSTLENVMFMILDLNKNIQTDKKENDKNYLDINDRFNKEMFKLGNLLQNFVTKYTDEVANINKKYTDEITNLNKKIIELETFKSDSIKQISNLKQSNENRKSEINAIKKKLNMS